MWISLKNKRCIGVFKTPIHICCSMSSKVTLATSEPQCLWTISIVSIDTLARAPCVPEISGFWVEQLSEITGRIPCFFLLFVFFPLACLFYLHSLSIQKYFSVMPWALFCFLLKLCVWASERGSKGFWECNPILWACIHSFSSAPVLFKKMLGGFSLKAWLLSCFCLITGHKVRSTSLASVQLLVIPFLLQKYSHRLLPVYVL